MAAAPGPRCASLKFSMRSCLAWMNSNRLVHSLLRGGCVGAGWVGGGGRAAGRGVGGQASAQQPLPAWLEGEQPGSGVPAAPRPTWVCPGTGSPARCACAPPGQTSWQRWRPRPAGTGRNQRAAAAGVWAPGECHAMPCSQHRHQHVAAAGVERACLEHAHHRPTPPIAHTAIQETTMRCGRAGCPPAA